jgi:hypothetical protein
MLTYQPEATAGIWKFVHHQYQGAYQPPGHPASPKQYPSQVSPMHSLPASLPLGQKLSTSSEVSNTYLHSFPSSHDRYSSAQKYLDRCSNTNRIVKTDREKQRTMQHPVVQLKNNTKKKITMSPLQTTGASFSIRNPIDMQRTPKFSRGIILDPAHISSIVP